MGMEGVSTGSNNLDYKAVQGLQVTLAELLSIWPKWQYDLL